MKLGNARQNHKCCSKKQSSVRSHQGNNVYLQLFYTPVHTTSPTLTTVIGHHCRQSHRRLHCVYHHSLFINCTNILHWRLYPGAPKIAP